MNSCTHEPARDDDAFQCDYCENGWFELYDGEQKYPELHKCDHCDGTGLDKDPETLKQRAVTPRDKEYTAFLHDLLRDKKAACAYLMEHLELREKDPKHHTLALCLEDIADAYGVAVYSRKLRPIPNKTGEK